MDRASVDSVVEQLTATALSARSARPGEPSDGTDYTLVLPEFEGPLDLLLHLVRKHELDVFNIPISFITQQYLLTLQAMQALNMDLASEYLLMAATLAYIKSRELLPPEAQAVLDQEEGEEAELGDPRELLVKRLLEYQKFKAVAELLAARPVVGRNVWTRDVSPEQSDIVPVAPLAEVPVWELIDLLAKLHGKRQRKLSHEVTVERLSLADRINQINEALDSAAPLIQTVYTYDTLLTQLASQDVESDFMYQAVLTLLAVLEMARLRLVAVYQAEERGAIYVCRPGVTPPSPQAPPASGSTGHAGSTDSAGASSGTDVMATSESSGESSSVPTASTAAVSEAAGQPDSAPSDSPDIEQIAAHESPPN